MIHRIGHPIVDTIYVNLSRSLQAMAQEFQVESWAEPFGTIHERLAWALTRIAWLLEAGRIDPVVPVRLSRNSPATAPAERTIKLGVYPVNGNTLHWGHLLCALDGVALHDLDLVVFLVQGIDRRKHEMSAATQFDRHEMARRVLRPFHPLLAYSSIGLDSELVGEDNLFSLLRLNAHQHIEATYIVGGDHYRTSDAQGNPDTLARLASNMADPGYSFDASRHSVNVLFAERGTRGASVPTRIQVSFLPEVLDISSMHVRRGHVEYTPYEAYQYLRTRPAYRSAGARATTARQEPGRPGEGDRS